MTIHQECANAREAALRDTIADLQRENDVLRAAYSKRETDLMDEVDDLEHENAGLRVELEQQAIVNGKGSEREAALLAKLEQLKRETASLREQVDDWENATLGALDHRSDEQHCTCVPPLLWKIKQLERENAALRSAGVETCAIARVWATVWHDKLSTESLQRFAELEQRILKEVKP